MALVLMLDLALSCLHAGRQQKEGNPDCEGVNGMEGSTLIWVGRLSRAPPLSRAPACRSGLLCIDWCETPLAAGAAAVSPSSFCSGGA